ncbi:MAG: response regulator [FCB group bacterium]|nr:response regulator [FCB group bacterium]
MKILLVDDEPITIKVVTKLLNNNNYDVIQANNGKSAIAELNKNSFIDMIISDIVMPEMDGFQLLKYIKSKDNLNKIPVLITSSSDDKDSVIKCIQLGAKDYMLKPLNPQLLLKKIDKILKKVPKSVLVVDDEELILNLLKKILEREKFDVITATSGEKALDMLSSNNIGVVISDIEMPGIDGLELLSKVKAKNKDISVLMITGKGGKYDKNYVLKAGADGYITKPFKNFEITEAVTRHLHSKNS